ncbi:hypothetical protein SCG7086_DF_00020 [Chlamydiales bacterium SCGC AG-110-P3]|nr:hypothetical protein SCG7086_DF_00020 [Chlamydiales bacterium SCGC AG-110-P3]
MRIIYTSGPGNIYQTYQHWKRGEYDPSEVSETYSGQVFSLCRTLGASGYFISENQKKKNMSRTSSLSFSIGRRPLNLTVVSGITWVSSSTGLRSFTQHFGLKQMC